MPCVFVWERTKINLLIFGSWMCALWIRWNNEIDTSLVVMDKRHFNPLYHLVLVHIHLYVLTYKNTHLFRMRSTNLIASMFLIKIIVGAKIYKKNCTLHPIEIWNFWRNQYENQVKHLFCCAQIGWIGTLFSVENF